MRSIAFALLVGVSTVAVACGAAAECPPLALIASAAKGEAEPVGVCVSEGADLNAANADGVTPLMAASARNHIEIVETLLAAGASVDAASNDGLTALMFAAAWGRRDLAGVLVDAGANVAQEDAGGRTAIDWARGSIYVTGDVAIVVSQYLQNADTAPETGVRRNVSREATPDLFALMTRAEAGAP